MSDRHPLFPCFSHPWIPLLLPLLLLMPTTPAPAATPEELLEQLELRVRSGTYGAIESLLISYDGELLMEEYYRGYNADRLHPMYSTTKSVTSALIGIAIDQGAISGVETRLLDYFPDYTPANLDARKEAITLDHLLKMQAGFVWDESSIPYTSPGNSVYELMRVKRNWMEYIVDQPMSAAPGTEYTYNSGVTMLLSRILSKSTGLSANRFASRTLFTDLGIDTYRWDHTPQVETNTGWGLRLRPLDMVKFGQLYLNDGYWQPEDGSPGKQVVSSEWVEASLQPYVDETVLDGTGIGPLNYGYQWWLFQDEAVEVSELAVNDLFFSWGYGGQFIFVVPHLNLVVATTASNYEDDGERFFPILPDYIFPAIQQLAVPEPGTFVLLSIAMFSTLTQLWQFRKS